MSVNLRISNHFLTTSITDPKWRDAEKNALLGLRKLLNLSVNVRPAVVYPYLAHLSPLKGKSRGLHA